MRTEGRGDCCNIKLKADAELQWDEDTSPWKRSQALLVAVCGAEDKQALRKEAERAGGWGLDGSDRFYSYLLLERYNIELSLFYNNHLVHFLHCDKS